MDPRPENLARLKMTGSSTSDESLNLMPHLEVLTIMIFRSHRMTLIYFFVGLGM